LKKKVTISGVVEHQRKKVTAIQKLSAIKMKQTSVENMDKLKNIMELNELEKNEKLEPGDASSMTGSTMNSKKFELEKAVRSYMQSS